jgi:GNAT superfamily N-acetyltransferase
LADAVPFLLQTRLRQLGAILTAAPDFQAHVVTDHRLVTGQNPASATDVAHARPTSKKLALPGSLDDKETERWRVSTAVSCKLTSPDVDLTSRGENMAFRRRADDATVANTEELLLMPTSFGETTVSGGPAARFGWVRFRSADAKDAEQIAALHADSWRRHYRGAYADSFLDGDVAADRRSLWSARFAAPSNTETVLAESDGRLIGFIHVVLDEDPRWGSLVDNLHVVHHQRRTGIGTHLLNCAARAVRRRARGKAMYLWVLQQNTAAQGFYYARGATRVETAPVPPPGGDPVRLNGTPHGIRMVWPDVARLLQLRESPIG